MKTHWITGGILFLSLACNAVLGAMMIGHKVGPVIAENSKPFRVVMERLAALPPEQRAQAMETIRKYRPGLRDATEDLQRTRRDTFSYVQSEAYTRDEAEKRFAALREKTTALQASGQHMVLDIIDRLTPEQRAELLKRKADAQP